ncbi:hypothetical protein F2Q69_00039038 [Brassica cretica]|uniref:Dolichol-phosphate mannosyltransferase subunit 3 n=1 Tax=Brassica cretica TaxID=69181 RepID=A0A8S9SEA3_BRACR|nr:hypothetical protein F2Q69_00039038 [Brassica cretica]
MKHVVKILSLLVAVSAFWIVLLQAAIVPQSHTWLLPIYFVVSTWMLWSINGWNRDNAVPYLSSRSSSLEP